jgi:hypothetical protein
VSIVCSTEPSTEETLRAELDISTQWLLLVGSRQRIDRGFTIDHTLTFDLDQSGAIVFAELMIKRDRWIVDPAIVFPEAKGSFNALGIATFASEDVNATVSCRTNQDHSVAVVALNESLGASGRRVRLSNSLYAIVEGRALTGFIAMLKM